MDSMTDDLLDDMFEDIVESDDIDDGMQRNSRADLVAYVSVINETINYLENADKQHLIKFLPLHPQAMSFMVH